MFSDWGDTQIPSSAAVRRTGFRDVRGIFLIDCSMDIPKINGSGHFGTLIYKLGG